MHDRADRIQIKVQSGPLSSFVTEVPNFLSLGFYCLKSEALEEKVEFHLGSSNLRAVAVVALRWHHGLTAA